MPFKASILIVLFMWWVIRMRYRPTIWKSNVTLVTLLNDTMKVVSMLGLRKTSPLLDVVIRWKLSTRLGKIRHRTLAKHLNLASIFQNCCIGNLETETYLRYDVPFLTDYCDNGTSKILHARETTNSLLKRQYLIINSPLLKQRSLFNSVESKTSGRASIIWNWLEKNHFWSAVFTDWSLNTLWIRQQSIRSE